MKAGEVVLFAGRNFIFASCGHMLVVAVVEGGWVCGSRRYYGWKVNVFLGIADECLQGEA